MDDIVLFHTHGINRFDFSTITAEDLYAVDSVAFQRKALLCPTVYLKQESMGAFQSVLERYAYLKASGALSRILGFAIEGPILGPRGGTPSGSVWTPTVAQWKTIASWFSLGVRYIVVSPDVVDINQDIGDDFSFAELLSLIYQCGGRIALGHFEGASPIVSADRSRSVIDFLEHQYERSPYLILTDHLFNDMPRNFHHSFRTDAERSLRTERLTAVLNAEWPDTDLSKLLGPVPAAILEAARQGRLTPSLNFDGGHVDLAVCRKVVDYLGPTRVIAITDHTEIPTLAGEALFKTNRTDLLYRADGVLAASSANQEQQSRNMAQIGLDEPAIHSLFYGTPLAALDYRPCRLKNGSSAS